MEKAKQARTANEQGGELDSIKLAVVSAMSQNTTTYGMVELEILKNELKKLDGISATLGDEAGTFKVTGKKGSYTVYRNGQVEEASGLSISTTTLKVVEGATGTLTATLSDELEGETVTWTTDGTVKLIVNNEEVNSTATTGKISNVTVKAVAGTVTISVGNEKPKTCTVSVVKNIDYAIIGENAIATVVSNGIEADDNTDINLVPGNSAQIEDIEYSITSGPAILTQTTGKIHINKIINATDTVVVKLTGKLSGIEKSITINVTKQLTALEKLTLGKYVRYTAHDPAYPDDATKTTTIDCRVLYNDVNGDNTYGLQIISKDSVQDVTLGKSDSNYTTGTDLQKAQNSYNNAIENLNNLAEKYINTVDNGLTLDARCVGSVSTVTKNSNTNKNEFLNKNDEELLTNPNNNEYLNTYVEQGYKGTDSHYGNVEGTDFNQMQIVGVINIGTEYWLASRYAIISSWPYVFRCEICEFWWKSWTREIV